MLSWKKKKLRKIVVRQDHKSGIYAPLNIKHSHKKKRKISHMRLAVSKRKKNRREEWRRSADCGTAPFRFAEGTETVPFLGQRLPPYCITTHPPEATV